MEDKTSLKINPKLVKYLKTSYFFMANILLFGDSHLYFEKNHSFADMKNLAYFIY